MLGRLILVAGLLLGAWPALAGERQPARLGHSEWVVAAQVGDAVETVCFEASDETVMGALGGAEQIACVVPTEVVGDAFELDGRRFRIPGALGVKRIAFARIALTSAATVHAIACRESEGLQLCSAPSEDTYRLVVLSPPHSPRLLDLEEITAQLSAIDGAVRRIRDEIETAQ